MEKVKDRYDIALQTLTTLKEVIDKLQGKMCQEDYYILCDSAIQRFEYSIDTFWKFLKLYLQDYLKVTLEATTPRAIIRAALDAHLFSSEDVKIVMDALTSRNETSHTYNEELAQKVIKELPQYYAVMHKIIKNISLP